MLLDEAEGAGIQLTSTAAGLRAALCVLKSSDRCLIHDPCRRSFP
jgi:hypothetical protein